MRETTMQEAEEQARARRAQAWMAFAEMLLEAEAEALRAEEEGSPFGASAGMAA